MSAIEGHKYILGKIAAASSIVGANVIDPDYKPFALTYFVIAVIIMYYVNSAYSIYVFKNDFILLLQCLCCCSCATQGAIKLYMALKDRKPMVSLLNFQEKVYQVNEKVSMKRRELCYRYVKSVVLLCRVVVAGNILATISFWGYPILAYIITGENELIMMVLVPFVDPKTNIGYIITQITQSLYTIFGLAGNFAADFAFAYSIVGYALLAELFKEETEAINDLLEQNEGRDSHELQVRLRNWILMHLDIMLFLETIDQIYCTTIFIELSTSAGALLLLTFSIVTTDWLGAYIYCIVCLAQMLLYCCLGTVVEYVNDKILEAIYDLYWYKTPIHNQKMVLITLRQAGQAKILTASFLAPCNVQTALVLLKSIYSFLMLLLQFSE